MYSWILPSVYFTLYKQQVDIALFVIVIYNLYGSEEYVSGFKRRA